MDSSVSPKDEIWFLRVCHRISTGPYKLLPQITHISEPLLFSVVFWKKRCNKPITNIGRCKAQIKTSWPNTRPRKRDAYLCFGCAIIDIVNICATLIMLLHDNGNFLCITVLKISRYDKNRRKICSYSLSKTLTYSLHGAILEKPTGSHLVKKFHAFYGIRRFITAFTSARHLSWSWDRSI